MSDYLYPSGAQVVLAPGSGPDDEAWHAARLLGLGGSDMAAISGLDKWTDPLEVFHTKIGTPVPRRDNPVLDEAAEWGHDLEPVIAKRFTKRTGLTVYPAPGTLRAIHPEWAMANLDGAVLDRGEWGVWEAKSRSSYALDEWLAEAPTSPWVQVQHYLGVTGWNYGYLAASIGGQRLVVHRIERDEDAIRSLWKIGEEFWRQVQDRTPPPVNGSEACGDLLRRLHPRATVESVTADADEVERLLRQRARALAQLAGPTVALEEAENRLRAIAGDATHVHVRGELAYSWPQYSRTGNVDWRAFAEDHPDIDLDAYRGPDTPYRVLRIPENP